MSCVSCSVWIATSDKHGLTLDFNSIQGKYKNILLTVNASNREYLSGLSQLALNWKFLDKIWKPDTTFLNGQRSYLHKITVPNRFIRVFPNGKVSYSQRLTLWARCPMHLGKYPFDSQSCPLDLGSFSYTSDDVVYRYIHTFIHSIVQ